MPGVAVEGFVPGTLSLVAAGILFFLGVPVVGTFLLLAAVGILLFFRDPNRVTAEGRGRILSAADGKVIAVEPVVESRYLNADALRISVFMSIFNVHINRITSPAGSGWPISRKPALRTNAQRSFSRTIPGAGVSWSRWPAWWHAGSSAVLNPVTW
jgi:phosphatidylserine decarboxylase